MSNVENPGKKVAGVARGTPTRGKGGHKVYERDLHRVKGDHKSGQRKIEVKVRVEEEKRKVWRRERG